MAGRVVRFVAVGAMVLAALVAPVAVPIRFVRERARRKVDRVEQVAPVRRQGASGTA